MAQHRGERSSLRGALASLRTDEAGSILPLTIFVIIVLMGFGVLIFDVPRVFDVQSQLQKGADALALAAAAELDRRPDAITRAELAINSQLVKNSAVLSDASGAVIMPVRRRYLRSLPASDADPITSAHEVDKDKPLAEQAAEARFVEIEVQPSTVSTFFPTSFLGTSGKLSTAARAVAGNDQIACGQTPVYICDPFKGTGVDFWDGVKNGTLRGKQIAFHDTGNSSPSGGYGWLEIEDTRGREYHEIVAQDRPPICHVQNKVDVKEGIVDPLSDALNTRFDIYSESFKKYQDLPAYRPALSVRKGYMKNTCPQDPPKVSGNTATVNGAIIMAAPADKGPKDPPPSDPGGGTGGGAKDNSFDPNLRPTEQPSPHRVQAMPRDECFYAKTCTTAPDSGLQVGDGMWDVEKYFEINFGITPPNGWTNAKPPTRYEVYLWEIEEGKTQHLSSYGAAQPTGNVKDAEMGAPVCNKSPRPLVDHDRRLLLAAVVDCSTFKKSGPFKAIARLFLTEPVGSGGDKRLFAELIDILGPADAGNDGVLHDMVQLYR